MIKILLLLQLSVQLADFKCLTERCFCSSLPVIRKQCHFVYKRRHSRRELYDLIILLHGVLVIDTTAVSAFILLLFCLTMKSRRSLPRTSRCRSLAEYLTTRTKTVKFVTIV